MPHCLKYFLLLDQYVILQGRWSIFLWREGEGGVVCFLHGEGEGDNGHDITIYSWWGTTTINGGMQQDTYNQWPCALSVNGWLFLGIPPFTHIRSVGSVSRSLDDTNLVHIW